MSGDWPDLVVGVDFGTTGTAVAYARPTENVVHQLKKWSEDAKIPDKDKVPTMISFEGNNVAAWGFGVGDMNPEEMPDLVHFKLFKPQFDSNDKAVRAKAEDCTRLFLEQLRLYLKEALRNEPSLKNFFWDTSRIKYVFSYPTTWDQDTQRRFSRLVEDAGYSAIDGQPMITSLDEAQASIIHFLCGHENDGESFPKAGELILVADIGGGTSDVGIFKVVSIEGREPDLFCEAKDEGKHAGSTFIDDDFKKTLHSKLKAVYQGHLDATPNAEEVHESAMNELVNTAIFHLEHDTMYLNQKHAYGLQGIGGRAQTSKFNLWLPDLLSIMTWKPHEQPDRKITIPIEILREEFFNKPFEDQCKKIWGQCEEQMAKLDHGRTIKHIVLTGGLGSSPYVVRKLSRHFRSHPRSKEAQVVDIRDPQLAVSRGLVRNELRNIYGNPGWVYPSAYSYGIQKGTNKDSIKWFLGKGKRVKVPHAFKVTRHVDIDPKSLDLSLVRTIKELPRDILPSDETKALWRNSIYRVPDVDISKWAKDSLPANLKADLSWKSSKTATLTIKGKMSRDAIAFALEHGDREHGHPLIALQNWHESPKPRAAKDKSPGRVWTWDLNKTIAAVGVGLAAVAVAIGAATLWNDLRKKSDDQKVVPPSTKPDAAGSSTTVTTTDGDGTHVEGVVAVGVKEGTEVKHTQPSSP